MHSNRMMALDLITVRAKQKFNIRDGTLGPTAMRTAPTVDLTPRRKHQSVADWKTGKPALLDPTFRHDGDTSKEVPSPQRPSRDADGGVHGRSAMNNGKPNARAGAGIWSDDGLQCEAIRAGGSPQTNSRENSQQCSEPNEGSQTHTPGHQDGLDICLNGSPQNPQPAGGLSAAERGECGPLEASPPRAPQKNSTNNDREAREGALKDESDTLPTEEEPEWQPNGAKLASLTVNQAYKLVR
ncbi:hypothetical protein M407DRAFT_7987 [Tulasnella calospora MUT 4182]|uniref:Uncharacterized protein n=1 Tax=Tulasnella calospora MUT 4182 TaxID=1051891 RepID=A0A0C3QJ99_9AGAM|nr:hypothetical protein M407DRAFT_7987 [Tulasnella calospora MUT 4182]